jgi:hypothetical protein
MLCEDTKEEAMPEKPNLKRSPRPWIALGLVISAYVLVKRREGCRSGRETAEVELPPPVVDDTIHYAHGDPLETGVGTPR